MKKLLRHLYKRFSRIFLGLALTGVAVFHVLGYLPSEVVRRLDYLIYDVRLRTEARTPKMDDNVVIVDIDEKSLREMGRWPWSRDVVGDLVLELTDRLGAAVVSFDVVFAEPQTSDAHEAFMFMTERFPNIENELLPGEKDEMLMAFDRDRLFAEMIETRPVVLGYYFNDDETAVSGALPPPLFKKSQLDGLALSSTSWQGYGANIPVLQRVADGGYFNPMVDVDGTVRAVPILLEFQGGYYQSLALATLRRALGNPQLIPVFPAGVPDDYGALESIELVSDEVQLSIPVERGLISLVNYRSKGGPNAGGYKYYSASDVLTGALTRDQIEGRIVLVGTTAPGLLDLRSTPVNPAYPGVEVHANVLSSMIDQNFKIRPEYAQGVLFVFVIIVGVVLSLLMPLLTPGWSLFTATFVIVSSIATNSYMYFQQNLVFPVAAVLLLAFAIMLIDIGYGYLSESRTKKQMVSLFGEYVAPELVSEMAENPTGYSMEGESRYLTVLFSDVRGFTTISESLEPNELREYINEYLTIMSEIIRGNRGTLDKYIGDAIMAFWGAPVADEQHAEYALRAGMAMIAEVPNLNKRLTDRGWPALAIGVGVNSGQMRVGDMGSKIRRAYTVMGDSVNLGSRLEGITKTYGVGLICGEDTKAEVPTFAFQELDMVRVKGKDRPVAIFQPLGPEKELTDKQKADLDQWNQFITAFRAQEWDRGLALLSDMESVNGAHTLYDLYRSRIDVFKVEPPPADWDGVTKFETK